MKRYIEKIVGFVKFDRSYTGQILFIFVGVALVTGTLLKLFGIVYIDSDWYWCLAGFGLIVEGIISFIKQKKFDKKYKVVELTEVNQ